MKTSIFQRAVLHIALVASTLPVGATPDLELNPRTGHLEAVELTLDGSGQVRHVVDEGQAGRRTTTILSSAPSLEPRIAISAAGRSSVVWSQPGAIGEIYFRSRSELTEAWTPVTRLSESAEDSRDPEIVYDGGTAWIAYEIRAGASTTIGALSVIDAPEPIPVRSVLGATDFGGVVDAQIHAEAGHVWVTWVDHAGLLGWCERDGALSVWGLPQFEAHGAEGPDGARKRVRTGLVGS